MALLVGQSIATSSRSVACAAAAHRALGTTPRREDFRLWLTPTTAPHRQQRRTMWWDPSLTRKNGKPAISKTQDLYVSKDIPVVLLKDVPKLGVKGQIVHVRRGYARNLLVPSGVAVYGALWENVDRYADPAVISAAEATARAIEAEQEAHPFDWIDEISLRLVRTVRNQQTGALQDPLTVWEFLNILSRDHELDLLPENLLDLRDRGEPQGVVPDPALDPFHQSAAVESPQPDGTALASGERLPLDGGGPGGMHEPCYQLLTTAGRHLVNLEIPFKVKARRYCIAVDIVSQTEEMAALRAREEERIKNQKPQFLVGIRSGETIGRQMQIDYEELEWLEDEGDNARARSGPGGRSRP
ncbi:unnamed protein product [Amoebophrya sp. A120]|nr:unnamed protein product [Amoebophrya sp. A120]|eukprot:GSA120T00025788001.1